MSKRDPLIEEEYQRRIRAGHVSWDELFERNQKAHEILQKIYTTNNANNDLSWSAVKRALEALEGK